MMGCSPHRCFLSTEIESCERGEQVQHDWIRPAFRGHAPPWVYSLRSERLPSARVSWIWGLSWDMTSRVLSSMEPRLRVVTGVAAQM